MIDRHLIGDVALAVLLSIPVAALAHPDVITPPQENSAATAQYQSTGTVAAKDRPVSLLR